MQGFSNEGGVLEGGRKHPLRCNGFPYLAESLWVSFPAACGVS